MNTTQNQTETVSGLLCNRRQFIQRTAAGIALPLFLPASVFGSNNRINLAWIGVGNQADSHLVGLSDDAVHLVAVCDVDENHFSEAWRRFPKVKFFRDFRIMLAEMNDQIDAVVIATPDHTHFAAAYMSLAMGKHVFVEKPLTHTVWEARTLKELAKRKDVKTQMGNQGHASEGIRLIREWYESGLVGDVTEIIAWTDRPHQGWGFKPGNQMHYPAPEPLPDSLDWDLWLGPVNEEIPYHSTIHQPGEREQFWRHWWAFGTGSLGDIGCHTIDSPFWAMNLDAPERVDVEMVEEVNPIHKVDGSVVTFHFKVPGGKPPVRVKWYEGPRLPQLPAGFGLPESAEDLGWGDGLMMVGTSGIIAHPGMRPESPRLFPEEMWQDFRSNPNSRPARTLPRIRGSIMSNFLDSIRDGYSPISDFNYAARLTEAMLVGTLALRTGKAVEYDAVKMRITNNPEADALLKTEPRKGWDIASLI